MELAIVLHSLGKNPTEKEVQAMIEDADADGNGQIDFMEFTQMILKR
jgi:Ca2+-binding EF-hand superfamily protein